MSGTSEDSTIESRIMEWLSAEGYPLEFSTAQAFRKAKFSVWQGYYVQHQPDKPPREVDVVASIDHDNSDTLIRIQHAVECKWSDDKPWVLFCGRRRMTTAACVTHMIGSKFGEALLWKDAGIASFAELELFRSPKEPAFGGRQAFSGSRDVLFDALRSVTGAAHAIAAQYDARRTGSHLLPESAVVVMPMIVVAGRLFEVRQGAAPANLALSEVTHSRLHWRGAGQSGSLTTVDIVSSSHLSDFLERRAADVNLVLEVMASSVDEFKRCVAASSIAELQISRGARGVIGYPLLVDQLQKGFKKERDRTS